MTDPAGRLIYPDPPALSGLIEELRAIEARGIYSNYGPVNAAYEAALATDIFGGGHVLAVNSGTTGLMLALKQAAVRRPGRRYALMPGFGTASAAQAALWAGLVPLFCDVDPLTWCADPKREDELLARHGEQVAAIVPAATFGHPPGTGRYAGLVAKWGCGVVMDASSGLGTRQNGRQLQAPVGAAVFSTHAGQAFATFEGGIIHGMRSDDLTELRAMADFGQGSDSVARLPGLNGKLPEVGALAGLQQLPRLPGVIAARTRLAVLYRRRLTALFTTQPPTGEPIALTVLPLLLPAALARHRPAIMTGLERAGIASATHGSPHLIEHPLFAEHAEAGPLPIAKDLAGRILCLPLHGRMDANAVEHVARTLLQVVAGL